ncbi:hypothetical protein HMPREF9396_0594 [Streptococcus sanguinis SK1059]|nr:hypothetical protein HMPREF9396_0594 [Streptococcus sanguinis SK1059]EGQ21020.1 hypothetical protein HMPREF8573_0586 [Streptococcus sanguinis ATCC 29667]EGQ24439.1 hypothetical protein HMPREF9387_1143 [Streptococcus sanguinis SK340]
MISQYILFIAAIRNLNNEKLLQTLTKYDKMKLVYLEKDTTYEISRTQ